MIVREILVKSVLSKSAIFDYVVNPYIGCQFACTYCYARFMKRFTRHKEPWGEFVDVKINASQVLQKEIIKKKPGRVWVSGVCDPYQPIEKKYELTRQCLQILLEHNWPVTIQTKSQLVVRDIELIKGHSDVEVGLSITTADENIKKIFEPNLPPIRERIKVLERLHIAGIRTFAMIAPMLPNPGELAILLKGKADYVLIDMMNYHYADRVYKQYELEAMMTEDYFYRISRQLIESLKKHGIESRAVC